MHSIYTYNHTIDINEQVHYTTLHYTTHYTALYYTTLTHPQHQQPLYVEQVLLRHDRERVLQQHYTVEQLLACAELGDLRERERECVCMCVVV
jgi:hypothetical protein